MSRPLPRYALIDRSLPAGMHAYLRVFPEAARSPALARIVPDLTRRTQLLDRATVNIDGIKGYCWIDESVPCIVLAEWYYREGDAFDLYLDLLHELTHIRQHLEGADIWDERFPYVDRITEIEGYAVAIEEGRRLGMTDAQVVEHLSNPWMSKDDVARLLTNVEAFLSRSASDARE